MQAYYSKELTRLAPLLPRTIFGPAIGQQCQRLTSAENPEPDVGLLISTWQRVKKKQESSLAPTPLAERHSDPGRCPAKPESQERNIHSNRWGSSLERQQGQQPRAPTVSKGEPENLGTEIARVAKCALVY